MSKVPFQHKPSAAYRAIEGALRPLLMGSMKRHWRGGEQLTQHDGVVVAFNHLSWIDPFVAAHFVNDHGRQPRFLAKSEIFKIPGVGPLLKSAGQIPVVRGSAEAVHSLSAAIDAVNNGECIVVYPEGTLTRDKNLWPMTAKTGAARIALTTGCEVIPCAQWGAQDILAPYGKAPKFFPKKTVQVLAGDPVNLDDLRNQPITSATLREATDRIMSAVTGLLAELRNEKPPAKPLDRRDALKKPEQAEGEAQ